MEIKTFRHPLINTLVHTSLVRKPSSLREVEKFSRHPLNRTAVLITEVCAVCHCSLLRRRTASAD